MKLLPIPPLFLLASITCPAQEDAADKEIFLFPDEFKLDLSQGEGSSEFTQIRVQWPAVEHALAYEVQLAELYAEGVVT